MSAGTTPVPGPGARLLLSVARQYSRDRWWLATMAVGSVLAVGLAVLFALVASNGPEPAAPGTPGILSMALTGWSTLVAAAAVAAGLVAGSEWTSGRYVVSFTLTPRRARVVTAHVVAAAGCTAVAALPVGTVMVVAAQSVAGASSGGAGGSAALGWASASAVVLLGCLGAACGAASGAALAMAARSRVAGVLAVALLFFVLPPLAAAGGWRPELLPAAQWSQLGAAALMDGGWQLAVAAAAALAWPLLATVAAVVRTVRRDIA
ncbi:hypothetical protein ACQ3I4_09010 [Zafaria sp. Z1313]|uniref:hypothetical protein n=1 Tax=unclassified Zafaria TaxID=2828765 RepID=UPI002E78ACC4|nr:hypothetical protein [Zafaria sp. J156]MEE1621658.1 hypothetical protein [Zafaria sp. J156]